MRSLPKAAIAISIDIPTALLRNAITSTSAHKEDVERSELMNYLRAQNDAFDNRAHILIDSALAESLSKKPDERNSIQVRVYDLDDSTCCQYPEQDQATSGRCTLHTSDSKTVRSKEGSMGRQIAHEIRRRRVTLAGVAVNCIARLR